MWAASLDRPAISGYLIDTAEGLQSTLLVWCQYYLLIGSL